MRRLSVQVRSVGCSVGVKKETALFLPRYICRFRGRSRNFVSRLPMKVFYHESFHASINRDVGDRRKLVGQILEGVSRTILAILPTMKIIPMCIQYKQVLPVAEDKPFSYITIAQANHLFKWLAIVLFALQRRQESRCVHLQLTQSQ